jgi:hypothetical protein
MLSTWTPRAAEWRRIVVGLVLTLAALAVSIGSAQAQAAAAAPAPTIRSFAGDVGFIVNIVKADKAAEFEGLIAKLKDVLSKSEKPERKAQAAGWRVLKSPDVQANGTVIYAFLIDPVVKDADYTMSKILYEGLPAEQQAIYDSIKACLTGVQYLNYQTFGYLGK